MKQHGWILITIPHLSNWNKSERQILYNVTYLWSSLNSEMEQNGGCREQGN